MMEPRKRSRQRPHQGSWFVISNQTQYVQLNGIVCSPQYWRQQNEEKVETFIDWNMFFIIFFTLFHCTFDLLPDLSRSTAQNISAVFLSWLCQDSITLSPPCLCKINPIVWWPSEPIKTKATTCEESLETSSASVKLFCSSITRGCLNLWLE